MFSSTSVCVCVCVYIYIYIHAHTHSFTCVYICSFGNKDKIFLSFVINRPIWLLEKKKANVFNEIFSQAVKEDLNYIHFSLGSTDKNWKFNYHRVFIVCVYIFIYTQNTYIYMCVCG